MACRAQAAVRWQSAVRAALAVAPDARIVVLDAGSGTLLAVGNAEQTARTLAAPGSSLKPLILYRLLDARLWRAERRVPCGGNLVIAGHNLACSHPRSMPFDARAALAWSCNSYFAGAALAVPAGKLGELLRPAGLLAATGLMGTEAVAEFREPRTAEETQLAVLGIDGIRVAPLELAAAYRWLAREIAAHAESDAARTVQAGLADSASFGMAGAASLGGVSVAGKTGTASGVETAQTHGWFAGFAPAVQPKVVIVVYLPAGRGADAARITGIVLAHSPLGKP